MKRLLAVLAIAAFGLPLGGCFDDLSDSVERLAGIPGQAVMDEVDEGLANAEPDINASIDAWVQAKEAAAGVLPAGAVCTSNDQCGSGECNFNGTNSTCG